MHVCRKLLNREKEIKCEMFYKEKDSTPRLIIQKLGKIANLISA